jgi:hypothetical protein
LVAGAVLFAIAMALDGEPSIDVARRAGRDRDLDLAILPAIDGAIGSGRRILVAKRESITGAGRRRNPRVSRRSLIA